MKRFTLFCWLVFLVAFVAKAQSDSPCNAPLLSVSPDSCHYVWGTTVGASYQNDSANGLTPSCASPGAADVWYRFVVPSGGAVAITALEGTITDGGMALYSGTCGALQFVQCEDDNGVNMMPVIDRSDLIPGDTMYVRFWYGWNANGTGTFRLCLVESNSDCIVATPLCDERYYYTHAYGPGSHLDANGSQCDITEYQSQWFKWRIASSGTLKFTILPDSLGPGVWPDWDWLLYQTTDSLFCTHFLGGSVPFACNGSSSYGPFGETGLDPSGTSNSVPAGPGNPYCPIINAAAGEYYYLMLNNFNVSSSGFTIHLGGTASLDCDFVDPPTGLVRDVERLGISAFPNPMHEWVTVVVEGMDGLEGAQLRLVDLQGKEILVDAVLVEDGFRIQLVGMAPGMYFVELRTVEGVVGRMRLVKE